MGNTPQMWQESAQMLAIKVLGWMAAQPELIGGFLGQSGLDPAELRTRAGDPEMLAAVLDYLLGDEQMLLDFCAETDTPPSEPARARAALPGGDLPHWT